MSLSTLSTNRILALIAILLFLLLVANVLVSVQPRIYTEVPTNVYAEKLHWKERIEQIGARAAYEELVRATESLSPTDQHVPAHLFGSALFETKGIEGMAVCDSRLLYGCFHEFFSQAIVTHGLSIVPELEARCPVSPSIDAPISCQHGIGHGLVAYFGYTAEDLESAVSECDALTSDPWHACLQGAFMEYQLRFFASADGSDARVVPDNNPYDPCTLYDGIYAERCVGLLPVWWRAALFEHAPTTESFTNAGELCRALPETLHDNRDACFRGIGFMAVTSFMNRSVVAESCAAAASPGEDREACMTYAYIVLPEGGSSNGAISCMRLPEDVRGLCEHTAGLF